MAPNSLPVLPLPHPNILLPGQRFTVSIPKADAEAILALIASDDGGELPVVAAIPLPDPKSPASGSAPLQHACAARVLRVVRPAPRNIETGAYLFSLQGLTRVQVRRPIALSKDRSTIKVGTASVRYVSNDDDALPSPESVNQFKSAAIRLLDRLQKAQSGQGQQRKNPFGKIGSMVEDISDERAAWMADMLVGSVPGVEWSDKFTMLSTYSAADRVKSATEVLQKLTAITEVASNVASRVDESLSKQQKEYFLRQQLVAIQRELKSLHSDSSPSTTSKEGSSSDLDSASDDADENDMAQLKQAIERMTMGSEERRMGAREYKRLKRIPPSSVESGVIRSYLEWLTALPWQDFTPVGATPRSPALSSEPGSTKPFLERARAQLDADHFGLEKVKRRLIEYLAVERLRERERESLEFEAKQGTDEEKAVVKYDSETAKDRKDEETKVNGIKRKAKPKIKAPILLFVGPPGTGKTSLGQSIARTLGRPFQRISLGGVRDEAEIRGHRRTYVASGPGLIAQSLRKMETLKGVMLLDEIDKISNANFHGDPAAALLEVLDPEQNHSFNDHYINVPIDLSQMLFICTANTLETISAPLLDRCEIVTLSGYTYDEKLAISRRFLLPKQLAAHGLGEEQVKVDDEAMTVIASEYTREAGVRSLERCVAGVVRFKAVEWAEFMDDAGASSTTSGNEERYRKTEDGDFILVKDKKRAYRPIVESSQLEDILGLPRWDVASELLERNEPKLGVVYGLVVTGAGEGGVLPVETMSVPGTGKLRCTGSLGDVIRESAELALSWVKRHSWELGVTHSRESDPVKGLDVHLHLPAGAQKKDGPSAGVAMVCAFVSLLTGVVVPANVAMTGEITLRGRVTPVGGVKEKVMGAHRSGIGRIILPYANRKDVESEVAKEVRGRMEFVFVRTVREALDAAFGKGVLMWRGEAEVVMESRL